MFLSKFKEDVNKWREIPCSWIERLNNVMMAIFFKLMYRCNTFPIKIPDDYFEETGKLILNSHGNIKNPE